MKSKFNTVATLLLATLAFGMALATALDPNGVWINEWGYLQKLGTLLILAIAGALAITAGNTIVALMLDVEGFTEDEIERVTRNPRVPEAK